MRCSLARFLVGLAWSTALASGCGPSRTAPPPVLDPTDQPEPARTIFFITTELPGGDPEGWLTYAHREANDKRAIFRFLGPEPGRPVPPRADLVRRAVADGASALVVTPGDAPGLPEALAEAEARGVAVVLIGRPIAPPAGSKPFTTVAPEPFSKTAGPLTAAALEDAKNAGRPADGTALIFAEKEGDAFLADRVAALKAAAEQAGLKARVFEFTDPNGREATSGATRAILDAPDLAIVLVASEPAMQLASRVHLALVGKAKFTVAGYVNYHYAMIPGSYATESGTVNYRGEELGRLAVRAALARISGEEPGRVVTFESKFRRGPGIDPIDPSTRFRLDQVVPAARPTREPATP